MKKAIVVGVYLFSLALLLSLGFWQLQRGQHKAGLEQQVSAGLKEPIVVTGAQFSNTKNYEQVRIEGYWLNQNSFLLQNRVYKGQLGVEVLTPFKPREGATLIVNRGWVSAEKVTDLIFNEEVRLVEVVGTVYKPSKGITIGESIIGSNIWPAQSLYIDVAAFAHQLDQPVAEKILVLEENYPFSFKKIWSPVTMSSTKHYGYAVQWFGLAITFIIFGFIWFRRRV